MDLKNELSSFVTGQIASFENLFVAQQCGKDIQKVVQAIEMGHPILELCEGEKGSFSTIFLPFHAGSMHPFNLRELEKKHNFPKSFIEFCELAGTIESKIDTFATYEEEPSNEEKNELLPLLRRFLEILPSAKQFHSWLEQVS